MLDYIGCYEVCTVMQCVVSTKSKIYIQSIYIMLAFL